MSYGGIISQGKFTQAATAVPKFIPIPSGVDRMEVINYTGSDGATNGKGTSYLWQRGMATDGGLIYYHPAGDQTLAVNAIASGGFTLVDSESVVYGASTSATGLSNATSMVVTTANTAGIVANSTVVRLLVESGDTLTDYETVVNKDFLVVSVNSGADFTLDALATAPGLTTGTLHFKIVYVDTPFYPRARIIAQITTGTTTEVYTTVPHGLTTGQKIRFSIPSTSGMTQLNPTTDNQYLSATVTIHATDTARFTADVDSTGFTAFSYPISTQAPVSFPYIIPFGMDSAKAISSNAEISADARVNTARLGMILGLGSNATAGLTGPAGAANDVMYWSAWKAANVTNE